MIKNILKKLKPTKKVVIIIISLILLIIITIGSIAYYIYQPIWKISDFVLNTVNSQEAKNRFAPNNQKIYVGYCKFDLLKPEIFTLFNYSEKQQQIIYDTIQKQSYFDQNWTYTYEKNAMGGSEVKNMTFEETKTKLEKEGCNSIKDQKNNPNITNYPPLTPSEIEQNRKRRETEEKRNTQQEKLRQEYNLDTLEGKKNYCKEAIKQYEDIIEAKKRGDKTFYFKFKDFTVQLDQVTLEILQNEANQVIEFCNNLENQ